MVLTPRRIKTEHEPDSFSLSHLFSDSVILRKGSVNWGLELSSEMKFGTHWPRSSLFTKNLIFCIHTGMVTLITFLCGKNAQNRLINLDLCFSFRYAVA